MLFKANSLVFLCFIILYIQIGQSVKFPATFKRCKVSKALDGKPNACLLDAIQDAIRQLSFENNKDLGVQKLDPLLVKNIYLERGDNSPVAIKLNFTDSKVIGFSSTKFTSISGSLSSPKGFVMNMDLFIDLATIQGPYTINGKVLILPIQGKGDSNITMVGITCRIVMTGEQIMKSGKEFMKLTDLKISISPKKLYIYLGNLFNGDKALGDNMNIFLNENWRDIYNELQAPLEQAFASIFFEYSRRIMDRIPFNRIFITE